MNTSDGFGCGAIGLQGFHAIVTQDGPSAKAQFKTYIQQNQHQLTFAVLNQTQKDAIAAFEELGGQCVAQRQNHDNTVVGLYVIVRPGGTTAGMSHNVKPPILLKKKKKKRIVRKKKKAIKRSKK